MLTAPYICLGICDEIIYIYICSSCGIWFWYTNEFVCALLISDRLSETWYYIVPSHTSQSASDKCPIMHHFVTKICTRVHISVAKMCIVGYGTDVLRDLPSGSISTQESFISRKAALEIAIFRSVKNVYRPLRNETNLNVLNQIAAARAKVGIA